MTKSIRMLSIKMRNLKGLKNDIFRQQKWDFANRRSRRTDVFYKKVALNNCDFTGKHLCRSLFFKVASLTLLKKTPTQVVFCKFCNILNSTSLVKQIRTAPFEHSQHHKVSDTMLRKQEFLWLILNFHKENYWKKNQPRKQFLAHSNQQKSQKRCDICSKLTIKTAERRHINDVVLMSLLLTVNIFHTFFVVFLLSSLNK